MIRLTSVDLPTFGRPTTATTGARPTMSVSRSAAPSRSSGSAVDSKNGSATGPPDKVYQPADDFVDAQLRAVQDDRVRRLHQRVGGPARVQRVPPGQVDRCRGQVGGLLQAAPGRPG